MIETYLALLRGINVGGNNIIPMSSLVQTFARSGFANAKTLIASGNVVFQTKRTDPRTLERTLEAALSRDFAYAAKVVVKSRPELDAIIAAIPKPWHRPSAANRYYVMFLRHTVDDAAIVEQLQPKAGVETLDYHPGALYWSAAISKLSRSNVARMNRTAVYQDVTVRNLNTTKKLDALVTATAKATPPGRAPKPRAPPW